MKMTFQERLLKLDRLHHLLRRKGTGSPAELAQRLNVCERTVYKLLEDLRNLDAPIAYCRQRCTYYYEYDVVLQIVPLDSNDASKSVKGGIKIDFIFPTARMVQGEVGYL